MLGIGSQYMLTTHDHSFWSPAGLAFHTALSMWPFLPLTCTLFWTWISLTALPCRPVPLICPAFYTTLWQQCPLPLIAYFLTGVLNRFPGFLYLPLGSGRIFSSEENMVKLPSTVAAVPTTWLRMGAVGPRGNPVKDEQNSYSHI